MDPLPQSLSQPDIKKVSSETILELIFNRSKDGDFKIHLKSPIDWSTLRLKGDNRSLTVGGVSCYRPYQERLPGINSCFHSDYFEYENYPNMLMLLAKGLDEGVSFNFGMIPVSNEKIKDWAEKFKMEAKKLYIAYVKPFSLKLTITSAIVEREEQI